MPPTCRLCARCRKPLSKDRAAKRKRYCYACEVTTRREQREAQHERRVEQLYGLLPGDYQRLYEA